MEDGQRQKAFLFGYKTDKESDMCVTYRGRAKEGSELAAFVSLYDWGGLLSAAAVPK